MGRMRLATIVKKLRGSYGTHLKGLLTSLERTENCELEREEKNALGLVETIWMRAEAAVAADDLTTAFVLLEFLHVSCARDMWLQAVGQFVLPGLYDVYKKVLLSQKPGSTDPGKRKPTLAITSSLQNKPEAIRLMGTILNLAVDCCDLEEIYCGASLSSFVRASCAILLGSSLDGACTAEAQYNMDVLLRTASMALANVVETSTACREAAAVVCQGRHAKMLSLIRNAPEITIQRSILRTCKSIYDHMRSESGKPFVRAMDKVLCELDGAATPDGDALRLPSKAFAAIDLTAENVFESIETFRKLLCEIGWQRGCPAAECITMRCCHIYVGARSAKHNSSSSPCTVDWNLRSISIRSLPYNNGTPICIGHHNIRRIRVSTGYKEIELELKNLKQSFAAIYLSTASVRRCVQNKVLPALDPAIPVDFPQDTSDNSGGNPTEDSDHEQPQAWRQTRKVSHGLELSALHRDGGTAETEEAQEVSEVAEEIADVPHTKHSEASIDSTLDTGCKSHGSSPNARVFKERCKGTVLEGLNGDGLLLPKGVHWENEQLSNDTDGEVQRLACVVEPKQTSSSVAPPVDTNEVTSNHEGKKENTSALPHSPPRKPSIVVAAYENKKTATAQAGEASSNDIEHRPDVGEGSIPDLDDQRSIDLSAKEEDVESFPAMDAIAMHVDDEIAFVVAPSVLSSPRGFDKAGNICTNEDDDVVMHEDEESTADVTEHEPNTIAEERADSIESNDVVKDDARSSGSAESPLIQGASKGAPRIFSLSEDPGDVHLPKKGCEYDQKDPFSPKLPANGAQKDAETASESTVAAHEQLEAFSGTSSPSESAPGVLRSHQVTRSPSRDMVATGELQAIPSPTSEFRERSIEMDLTSPHSRDDDNSGADIIEAVREYMKLNSAEVDAESKYDAILNARLTALLNAALEDRKRKDKEIRESLREQEKKLQLIFAKRRTQRESQVRKIALKKKAAACKKLAEATESHERLQRSITQQQKALTEEVDALLKEIAASRLQQQKSQQAVLRSIHREQTGLSTALKREISAVDRRVQRTSKADTLMSGISSLLGKFI